MEHTAFKIWPLLDRRRGQEGGASPQSIRSLAVDEGGSKVYLGLDDGLLEEHSLVAQEGGAVTAPLSARRHVSKKALVSVVHLGADAGSLAVLTEDGGMQLVDCESLEAQALPLRHVLAACVDLRPGQPPLLAVAERPSKRVIRVGVYAVPRGEEPWGRRGPVAVAEVPDGSVVKGMAWVGPHLVICTGLKYIMVAPGQQGGQWRELFAVPEELAYSPLMTQPLPQRGQAMLVVGPAGIIVDASGSPVGSALRLDGLATPRALASSGAYVLAACEDAIHVFDCQGGGEAQLLEYGGGMRPLPGQPMYGACNPSGSCVALAGRQVVWACLPVSLEEQAREVLRRREYGRAAELVERGLGLGQAWAEVASAQAALCMLHDCLFEGAGEALERCSPQVFQPSELFPLFPAHTRPWLAQVPAHKRYWGLAPPLRDLDAIISHKLSRLPPAPSSHHGSETSSNGRAAAAGGGGAGGRPNGQQPQQQPQQHRKVKHAQPADSSDSSGGGGGAGATKAAAGTEEGEAERLWRQALQSVVQYLFRARVMGGVACPEGVDTLLLHLLADLGAVRQLAAFAAVPNCADAGAVAARLQAQGWHHALATLWAARGDAESALRIWRGLVEGGGQPDAAAGAAGAAQGGEEIHAAEHREALESAAALLRSPATASDATVLSSLPWLLRASPPAALAVLVARPLDPQAALQVLPPDSEARWQYLDHLVACMMAPATQGAGAPAADGGRAGSSGGSRPGSAGGAAGAQAGPGAAAAAEWAALLAGLGAEARGRIHTELATQLVAAILRQQPALQQPQPPAGRPPAPRPAGRGVALAQSVGRALTAAAGVRGGGEQGSAGGSAGAGAGTGGGGVSRRTSAPQPCSTAALVSRCVSEEEGAAPVGRLRLRLRRHLEESGEYDRGAALGCMLGTGLHEELVVLHAQLGDHLSALRLLALTLRDIAAAEAYAVAHLPPSEYRTLLQLVLHPGGGQEPQYEDACYLVTALGEHLDPLDILSALPAAMPLAAAAAIVAPMLRDRLHRRRQGAVVKNLRRATLTAARAARADAESARVMVDDERACPGCHLRIGGKVFVVLQAQHAQQQQIGEEGTLGGGQQQRPAAGAFLQLQHGGGRRGGQQQAGEARDGQGGGELRVLCYNCYRRMVTARGAREAAGNGGRAYNGALEPM